MKRRNFQEAWLISVWLFFGGLGGIASSDQGFSVSSDGKQILYTHTDRAEYDLMLVENFR
jgi:hypothetical protein